MILLYSLVLLLSQSPPQDSAREFDVGDAAVVLQFLEDFPVDGVETVWQGGPSVKPFFTEGQAIAKHYCAGDRFCALGMWIKGCISCMASPMAYIAERGMQRTAHLRRRISLVPWISQTP